MNKSVDVVIVGAGPYGLSLAAHLRHAGVSFRIFGKPMSTWREHMPAGMFLKSDGFASNLSDPAGICTLKKFCEKQGVQYEDTVLPVSLNTFCAYGLSFQQQMVPDLEQKWVIGIDRAPEGFKVEIEGGEVLTARKVVMAVGITHFDYVPPVLEKLPADLVSHSSRFGDISTLRGKSVTVIGRGSSACDLAAELVGNGVDVTILTRSPEIRYGGRPSREKRSLWQRVRHPSSGLGASLRSRIYSDFPWFVHMFPQPLRARIVRRHLGPAAPWTVKDRIAGKVPTILGSDVRAAEAQDGKVRLTLRDETGNEKFHVTDHVIAATGYRPDMGRLKFLSENLRSQLRMVDSAPVLSQRFESSIPGLYFTGLASAPSFGPLMRFAFGVDYTATLLGRHLAGSAKRVGTAARPSPVPG